MKKFFKVLLLAAVALMPVMGMAQTFHSPEAQFERARLKQQYEDSVAGARQAQLDRHTERMAQLETDAQIRKINAIWDDDVLTMACFIAAGIIVLVLCLRHLRRKAEDHKELINKLIDNNLLNSTEPISKEAIEALMKPKKTEKERFIGDATLLGLGIGLFVGAIEIHGGPEEFLRLAGLILFGLGLFRLIIRTITTIIERINAKRKLETKLMEEAVRKQRTDIVQEAEVIEEK
ncbi:MAG: hypothetical protein IKL03_07780 [Bacteroidaceae bacterium]|nr:hypothetical protein [Bacteroidaceae bacterium]MBR6629834.1 hypothetical protein [Bacteroidaceae bacterium]